MNLLKWLVTKLGKKKMIVQDIKSNKPTINMPAKQYDITNMSFIQKAEILFADSRFYGWERKGSEWKITVCTWSGGMSMKPVSFVASKDTSVDWALNTLNLVK